MAKFENDLQKQKQNSNLSIELSIQEDKAKR